MLGIKNKLKQIRQMYLWRKLNNHNYTLAKSIFEINNVKVGKKTYGELNVNLGTNKNRKITIGNYCSIGPNVHFIINPHNYHFFSTWGWQIYEFNERNYDWETKISIVVEDDVWIGQGAIILGGSVLHQGCVIGAGTVVNKEIPPYAIYAGNKIIKYRFSESICKKLQNVDYSKFNQEVTNDLKGWHKIEIDENNIDEFLKLVPLKGQD